jgi:hypothetical protein
MTLQAPDSEILAVARASNKNSPRCAHWSRAWCRTAAAAGSLQVHRFLQTARLGRFGAVATRNSHLVGQTVEDTVLYSLKNRFLDLLKWSPCRQAVFVFEHSPRMEAAVQRHFGDLRIEANGVELPHDCCWMPKSACEPLLEIADWLIHTVAVQVRFGQKFPRSFTDDLCAAFHSVDPRLASYIDVTSLFPNIASSRPAW